MRLQAAWEQPGRCRNPALHTTQSTRRFVPSFPAFVLGALSPPDRVKAAHFNRLAARFFPKILEAVTGATEKPAFFCPGHLFSLQNWLQTQALGESVFLKGHPAASVPIHTRPRALAAAAGFLHESRRAPFIPGSPGGLRKFAVFCAMRRRLGLMLVMVTAAVNRQGTD